jgi:hypothetical protein
MNRREMIERGAADLHALARAIVQAGREGDEAAIPAIEGYLEHENYEVRGAAIRSLVYYMEKDAYFERAARMIREDADFAVRRAAISSVGCLGRARPAYEARAVDLLVEAVRATEDPLEAESVYRWLRNLGVVPFRQWDGEPPGEVLAAIKAALEGGAKSPR